MHEISETPMAFAWPEYQVPEPILSAVSSRRPPSPERRPPPMEPATAAVLAPSPSVGTWILVMLFILQLALIGIVADLHIQQRTLFNLVMVSMAQKKFGVPVSSVR
jgi:hypothetical protein